MIAGEDQGCSGTEGKVISDLRIADFRIADIKSCSNDEPEEHRLAKRSPLAAPPGAPVLLNSVPLPITARFDRTGHKIEPRFL